ncbi:hypothetical protein K438DRAFT_1765177 [Mycena galopus ATCC 62051]|nr:hypothetical protein K438DRAFT_1765177 [Mycena galopus ATCC 62051]
MALFSFLRKLRRLFNPIESPQYLPSHFLSLPCELRLQIYDAVPLNCQVSRPVRRKIKKTLTKLEAEPPLPVPWLSLMLVCKTIADELRNYVHASLNTTYHLEVNNLKNWHWITMITWRRIPCPPSCARKLHVDLIFNTATRFGASGGSEPILGDLLCILNHFIHNGPVLDRKHPLRKHIRLNTLIFQIRVTKGYPRPGEYPCSDEETAKKRLRGDFEQYISRLVEQGILFGAIDKVVCRSADGDGEETTWVVSRRSQWTQYDFAWGVSGSSSLRAKQPWLSRGENYFLLT